MIHSICDPFASPKPSSISESGSGGTGQVRQDAVVHGFSRPSILRSSPVPPCQTPVSLETRNRVPGLIPHGAPVTTKEKRPHDKRRPKRIEPRPSPVSRAVHVPDFGRYSPGAAGACGGGGRAQGRRDHSGARDAAPEIRGRPQRCADLPATVPHGVAARRYEDHGRRGGGGERGL